MLSGTLENGVIHGDVFEFGINGAKFLFVLACANERGDFFHFGVRRGQVPFEIFEKRFHAPEEHSGVPMEIAVGDVEFGDFQGRLFREAAHSIDGKSAGFKSVTHLFDITEASFGMRWRYSENDHAAAGTRDIKSGGNDLKVFCGLRDVVIGGEHSHQRVGICCVANVKGGESDGGGSVATEWFGENVFARRGWKLFLEGGGLFGVGHAPDAIGWDERAKASDGLLEHGLLAEDVEELLGRFGAASRPETSAAAPGKYHGMNWQTFAGHSFLQ